MWESLQLFNSLQLHEIIHIGEKLYEKKEFEKKFSFITQPFEDI